MASIHLSHPVKLFPHSLATIHTDAITSTPVVQTALQLLRPDIAAAVGPQVHPKQMIDGFAHHTLPTATQIVVELRPPHRAIGYHHRHSIRRSTLRNFPRRTPTQVMMQQRILIRMDRKTHRIAQRSLQPHLHVARHLYVYNYIFHFQRYNNTKVQNFWEMAASAG